MPRTGVSLAAAALLLGAGCIDFPTPDEFACEEAKDCADGELCSSGVCKAPLRGDATHAGKTLERWSVVWTKWLLELPRTNHPIDDTSGGACDTAQSGDVFFLVGVEPGTTADRTECHVPADKWLLFPLFFDYADNSGVDPSNDVNAEQLKTLVAGYIDGVEELTLELDGQKAERLEWARVHPQVFAYDLDADDPFHESWPSQPNAVFPAALDGYFVLLPPLGPGAHDLRFGGRHTNGVTVETRYRWRATR